ncbi:MAG: hypothetical protein AUH29_02915 [Candidatus Rokubacteria bacterium 13_1_40CM_69_27]|nr:MAG: hypothetical protein AUH29_02915 [Candidatus Rokubacteria bacterium 13_1_40CM_69_27]OLC31238.1 MAG: hypothetical protein AUH81_18510 [Candidatus Rokubacteria bacterium 13_1_40CM_4_69_5]
MIADILVDTNVLVYAYDGREPRKQARALETLGSLVATGRGALSAQVLGEWYRAVTGKLRPVLSATDAASQAAALLRAWRVLPVTSLVVLEATRGARDHRLAYWDAQIWATARLNQVPLVLSEDFPDGRVLEGVRFCDPFARSFTPAALGI